MTLIHDHFQNYKRYNIPKAQLVIADIPYNVGINAYASNPQWYKEGDLKNGQSDYAGKQFFDTDKDFRIPEYFHFCNKLVKPEPKGRGEAGCMIVFCAFEQQWVLTEEAKKYNFMNYINLVFYKNYSPLGAGFEEYEYITRAGKREKSRTRPEDVMVLDGEPFIFGRLKSWSDYTKKERRETIDRVLGEMYMAGVNSPHFQEIVRGIEGIW